MKVFENKTIKLLNIDGRNWGLLILAILLAFSTWIIHRLSSDYSVYLKVNVVAVSNIEGYSDRSVTPTEVMARFRTTGWHILYQRLHGDGVVEVKIPKSTFQAYDGNDELFFISSDKLHEYAEKIFGNNVSVEYFVTDKVDFRFSKETHVKVPVKPVSTLSFEDQYIATGPFVFVPDSVIVYGDKMHLDGLEYVTTDIIKQTAIDQDFSGMVRLTPINGMRFSVDEVHYQMNVTRYLEVPRKSVPVIVEGVPAGKKVIVEPSTVNVVLDVVFPLKADPNKDLSLVVHYDDLKTSLSGLVNVVPSSTPLGTVRCEISPVAVRLKEVE